MMFTMESVSAGDLIAKGGCYICLKDHADKDGPLVDFDIVIEAEGRLVLCARCLQDGAHLLGWVTPEQNAALASQLADALRQISVLRMRLGKYSKALQSLRDVDEEERKHSHVVSVDAIGKSDGTGKVSIPIKNVSA